MDLLSLEGGGAIESPVGRAEALTYEVPMGGWEKATVVAIGPRSALMEELARVRVPSGVPTPSKPYYDACGYPSRRSFTFSIHASLAYSL